MIDKKRTVLISDETHRRVKVLAVENGRRLNCDFLDDLLNLGISEFHRVKNFTPNVKCTLDKAGRA